MTIVYQGKSVETTAKTVEEFLAEKCVDPAKSIVEYSGEVYAPGSDLASLELKPDAPLDVFKLTAGG